MAGDILFPFLLNVRIVVQVELAVDDLPDIRIALGRLALRDSPGAVAAILRRVLRGIGLECGEVLGIREAPRGAHVGIFETLGAFDRFTGGEVGDGIIAAYGILIERTAIDWRFLRE